MSKFIPCIRVTVSFMFDDFVSDKKIEGVALHYKGIDVGSGLGGNLRDLDFDFWSLDDASNFVSAVRKIKKIKNLNITTHVFLEKP